jgi:hypothetical protein
MSVHSLAPRLRGPDRIRFTSYERARQTVFALGSLRQRFTPGDLVARYRLSPRDVAIAMGAAELSGQLRH